MNHALRTLAGAAIFGACGPALVWLMKVFFWGTPEQGLPSTTPLLANRWIADLFMHYAFYAAPLFVTGAVATFVNGRAIFPRLLQNKRSRLVFAGAVGALVWLACLPLFAFGEDLASFDMLLFTASSGAVVSVVCWLPFDRLLRANVPG
jgi:hypothetical protein